MNKIAKCIVIIFAVIIIVLLWMLAFVNPPQKNAATQNAISAMPGYPISPDGHVEIMNPVAGQVIVSPVIIKGSVTGGGWFFEATFPIKVVDADGIVLGQGQAQVLQSGGLVTQ